MQVQTAQNPFVEDLAPPPAKPSHGGPGNDFTRHRGLIEIVAETDEGVRDEAVSLEEGYGG